MPRRASKADQLQVDIQRLETEKAHLENVLDDEGRKSVSSKAYKDARHNWESVKRELDDIRDEFGDAKYKDPVRWIMRCPICRNRVTPKETKKAGKYSIFCDICRFRGFFNEQSWAERDKYREIAKFVSEKTLT